MVKFTPASIFLLAIAAISTAAPISPSASPSPSPSPLDANIDIPITIAAENDVFSSAVKYNGRATWFTDSYGACNENWDGQNEPIVALNAHQMGVESWGNPACNKRVQITNKKNGKTVVARIVDKCPGDQCAFGSLDLSPAAFKRIGEMATGILNIEWNYL
ncbi:hypothetical protein BG011_008720 [Mortierella polycephala]|uniref:RlpA-like protein double-psi beta-barrel domain-containing protein n=1 Tax=Mortierella polycephala TaxID=41804 RepID=A0A9P6PNG1_9FUNG|nr:hypothetical protein BG011_008720 [Mortierella polycephala]